MQNIGDMKEDAMQNRRLPRAIIRQVYELIPEIIDNEDQRLPFTDVEIAAEISKTLGTKITSNIVFNYRRKLGIPHSGRRTQRKPIDG